MKTTFKTLLGLSVMAMAAQVAAQVTLYEDENFGGRNFTTNQRIGNMEQFGFNNSASSVTVAGQRWEVCEESRLEGNCTVLRPGRYPSLAAMGMNNRISSLRMVRDDERIADSRYAPLPVTASATFFEKEQFGGRSFTARESIANLEEVSFNNRASSVEITGGPWKACEERDFGGRCVVLQPGRYPSLAEFGMNNRLSSVQHVRVNTPPVPAPVPVAGSVTFYEREQFGGRTFTTQERSPNFERIGFWASSAEVVGTYWQVCDDSQYGGRCVVLPPGRYPSLTAMGLTNSVASVQEGRPGIANQPLYDARPRNNERLYEVPVTSVKIGRASCRERVLQVV